MKRLLYALYAVVCYFVFFGTFLYAIGFVENWHVHLFGSFYFVPKAIDFGGEGSSTAVALLVNGGLLGLFAVQHSGMARRGFKAFWTRVLVPKVVERSTYVLLSSLCLILLFAFWRPMPEIVWSVGSEPAARVLQGLSLLGWGIVLLSSFLINHFHLFGLQQVYDHARGVQEHKPKFRFPGLYRLVRHPIYMGFIIAFWATPVMTVGHLLFAAVTTAYILVAIQFEERDLVDSHGETYERYRRSVGMLIPKSTTASPSTTAAEVAKL